MTKTLAQLCTIQTGITLRRGSSAPAKASRTHLISLTDMHGLQLSPSTSEPQSFRTKIDRYITRAGDVLFTNRGTSTKAAVMPEHPDTFIAPAHLSIISPTDPEQLDPHYLALYLLSEQAAQHLRHSREGSAIPLISKSALAQLPIPVPHLQTQQKLVQFHLLIETEKKLNSQLNDLHHLQLQHALSNQ